MSYPNPCDSCAECTADTGRGCDAWRMRFRTIWKQFNSYQIRQYRKKANGETKFVYEHPDLIRKHIQDGPCKGCEFESLCEVPCAAYFHWWDARMVWLKGRLGM